MTQNSRFLLIIALAMALGSAVLAQSAGDYQSATVTGNWSAIGTWQTYDGSSWIAASTIPTASANVTIITGNTIALDVTATVASVTINDGGALTFTGTTSALNSDITVNGALTSLSGGSMTVSGNITCSGPNASVKFGSNGAKITGVAGKTFTLANGALLVPASNNGNPPGASGNIITMILPNFTFVIDNSVALTTVTFKNSGNCCFLNPPNGQMFGNLKFSTSSGAGPKTLKFGSDLIILGNLAFEPASTTGLGAGDAAAWTWDLGIYKIRTLGAGKTITAAQLSNHALFVTGTADTLFPGFSSCNLLPPSNGNCMVNYSAAAGTQYITNGTYQRLSVSGGGAKALLGNATVNDTLKFVSGSLSTGIHNLSLGSTAKILGETGTSCVVGQLSTSRTIGGAIGSSQTFGGMGVTLSDGSDDLGVVTVTRNTGSGAAVNVGSFSGINANWGISTANAPTATRNLTLTWFGVDDNGSGFTSLETAQAHQYNGITWIPIGTAADVSGADPRAITVPVSSYSSFTVSGISAPLPVELVSFKGSSRNGVIELTWKTATEANNAGFEVERKSAANGWAAVGFVAGAGNSSVVRSYAFTDRGISAGTYSYRLKQIDKDGKFVYSGTVEAIVVPAAKVFALNVNYPNPFNPSTTISFTVAQTGHATLKVYNVIGQEIATLFNTSAEAGTIQSVSFDAATLPSGLYFSVLESGGQRMMQKMLLAK